jgi:HAD superfamily hydrolase (TIGR01549 family)
METALLLDFGGTLDSDGVPTSDRFFDACAAGRNGVPLEMFRNIFRASDHQLGMSPGIERFGFRRTVRTQAQLLAELLGAPSWFDVEAAAARFADASEAIAARNRPVLARLAALAPIAIVSNFTGNVEPCLDELGLLRHVSIVLDSAREGVRKPDPQIFRRALSRLGGPASAWMVGDNFEADIRPAEQLGLMTCWLAPPTRALPAPGIATARVASFTELPELLACMV